MKTVMTLDGAARARQVFAVVRTVSQYSEAQLTKVEGFDDRFCIELPTNYGQAEVDALYHYASGVFDALITVGALAGRLD